MINPLDVKARIIAKKDELLRGTGSWIYKQLAADEEDDQPDLQDAASIFNKWTTDQQSSVLWIHGGPGKGKTMLAISLIDELSQHLTDGIILAYFFCENSSEKSNAVYIVRTLLWQIIRQQPSLATYLREEYRTQKAALLSSSADGLSILLRVLG